MPIHWLRAIILAVPSVRVKEAAGFIGVRLSMYCVYVKAGCALAINVITVNKTENIYLVLLRFNIINSGLSVFSI